jgi:hypothetical protein
MRGWQGQPRKMVEYEHWQKSQAKISIVGLWVAIYGGAENDPLVIRPGATKFKHTF